MSSHTASGLKDHLIVMTSLNNEKQLDENIDKHQVPNHLLYFNKILWGSSWNCIEM